MCIIIETLSYRMWVHNCKQVAIIQHKYGAVIASKGADDEMPIPIAQNEQ